MKANIFYSWQSDIKAAANRTFIEDALELAVKHLQSENKITVEPVIDRDTKSIPGSPDISSTILKKIDNCQIFVGDVTVINSKTTERPTPNPNVLIELGYAMKALGSQRIILIQNTYFGGIELLPFDIRQRRIITYYSPLDINSRSQEKKSLKINLEKAISSILNIPLNKDDLIKINILHKEIKITQEHHDYGLIINLENIATRRVDDWYIDVEFPTELLQPNTTYASKIDKRSNEDYSLFRSSNKTHSGSILPNDSKLALSLDYYIDNIIFFRRNELLDKRVTVTLYIDGKFSKKEERNIRELQSF